jgi:hypothetical protein
MPQFEYCPPFAVFNGNAPGVGPTLETHSLKEALSLLRTRPRSNLAISVLVTDGDVSTLIPVTLTAVDLAGKNLDDTEDLIASSAELRFRSMPVEVEVAASA